jgi:hypothetical protein
MVRRNGEGPSGTEDVVKSQKQPEEQLALVGHPQMRFSQYV